MEEKNRGLQWSHIEPYCLLRTLLRQLWMLLMAPSSTSVAVSRSSRVTVWFMEYTRGRDRAKRGAS